MLRLWVNGRQERPPLKQFRCAKYPDCLCRTYEEERLTAALGRVMIAAGYAEFQATWFVQRLIEHEDEALSEGKARDSFHETERMTFGAASKEIRALLPKLFPNECARLNAADIFENLAEIVAQRNKLIHSCVSVADQRFVCARYEDDDIKEVELKLDELDMLAFRAHEMARRLTGLMALTVGELGDDDDEVADDDPV